MSPAAKNLSAANVVAMLVGTLVLAMSASAAEQRAGNGETTDSVAATAAATRTAYIVQGPSTAASAEAVRKVGGTITHELDIIDAVGATLTRAQFDALTADTQLQLSADVAVGTQGGVVIDQYARQLTGVDRLAAQGLSGSGVTVAIVDTGIWYSRNEVKNDSKGKNKILAMYDAIAKKEQDTPDGSGHGSHVASIIGSPDESVNGQPLGMAPMAKLVAVKAFGATGQGSYTTVIEGLNWLLTNKTKHNIRVVNLSFGATPQSFYWNDPLARAVMKLWQSGLVVVASAGNWGPYAQSITVPGNVPYVITVGAMTDNYTPANPADDRLASFSSTGPTYEGFIKPEIVAPGGHMVGKNDRNMAIPKAHPEFATSNDQTFVMSGTSQSAAAVSGVVALMLQAQPSLTPDEVKCKLMSSARSAVGSSGKPAYSVFQQGAGLISAYDAVYSQNRSCANVGLDVAADLAGTKHFGGPARQHSDGAFYVVDANGQQVNDQGYLWNNGYLWNQGYLWSNGYLWNNGYLWSNGYLWNNGYLWKNGYLWNQSFVASTAAVAGINVWVEQE